MIASSLGVKERRKLFDDFVNEKIMDKNVQQPDSASEIYSSSDCSAADHHNAFYNNSDEVDHTHTRIVGANQILVKRIHNAPIL